jgi:hypothetical protein
VRAGGGELNRCVYEVESVLGVDGNQLIEKLRHTTSPKTPMMAIVFKVPYAKRDSIPKTPIS